MSSPPVRPATAVGVLRGVATAVAFLVFLVAPVAAQGPLDPSTTTGLSLLVDALLGATVTLLIGGGLVVLAPAFTERTTDRLRADPVVAFLWGLAILVAAFVLAVLLAISIVGILLIVPLFVALIVLGTIGYLAAGRAVVDDRGRALLVAVVVAGLASGVPYVGGLVGFVLGSAGVGAWYLEYRDDGPDPGEDTPEIDAISGGTSGSAATAQGGDGGHETVGGDGVLEGGGGHETGSGGTTRGSPDQPAGAADTANDAEAADDAETDPGDEWTAGFEGESPRE